MLKENTDWKTTFENLIEEYQVETPKKLRCLVKCVSATIYQCISDCTMYESAFNTLDKYFINKYLRAPSSSKETTNNDGKHEWVFTGATQVE